MQFPDTARTCLDGYFLAEYVQIKVKTIIKRLNNAKRQTNYLVCNIEGTVMPCTDPTSYPEVTNAIIRSKYSESDEMAIHRHHGNTPEEYSEEWQEYNEFCESAKALAKNWLGIE